MRMTHRAAPILASLFTAILAFVFSAGLSAQTNLALTGTAAHSGGGSGVWGPDRLNNGDTTGTYNDCWTSAGGSITMTWSSPQSIETMIIWYTRYRSLGANYCFHRGTVQYLDSNNQWQTDQNYDDNNYGTNDDETITLTQVRTTTSIRITSLYAGSNIMIQEWQIFEPAGPSLEVTCNAGTVQNVYAHDQGAGSAGLALGSFEIECVSQANGELTEIELEASGTMDVTTDFTEVKIYRDDNANNMFDPGTDVEVGTCPTFSGAQGTSVVPVTGSEQNFSLNQTKTYFVVGKLSGMATPGETMNFNVNDITVGSTTRKNGVPSTTVMTGVQIEAPDFNLSDASATSVVDAILGSSGNVLMAFEVAYPNGPDNMFSSIELTASGTGDDSTAYNGVMLYLDDGDAAFDANVDAPVGASEVFLADDGALTLALSGAEVEFSEGETKLYFVVAEFNLSGNHGETYAVQMTGFDGALTGTNIVTPPIPANGPAPGLTMLGNVLRTIIHTNLSDAMIDNDAANQVLLDFTLQSTNADWDVHGIIFEALGSGDDASAFSELQLYQDLDQSGDFDINNDIPITNSSGNFQLDDGTWEAMLQDTVVSKNIGARHMFLVGQLSGGSRAGDTFQARIQGFTTTPPSNGIVLGAPSAEGPTYTINPASFDVTFNGPMAATSVNNTALAQLLCDVTLETRNDQFNVSELTFTASGTGNDATAFSELALYEDDGDGSFDFATDTLATSVSGTAFSADNGDYVAVLANPMTDGPSTRQFFLVASLNGSALSADTFNATLSAVNSTSVTNTLPAGVPSMTSTALLIDNPVLTVGSAPGAPIATVVEKTGADFGYHLGSYVMSASNGDISVSGVQLKMTGTGDWVNDVSASNGVQLYLDDGDGQFDAASDSLLGESGGDLGLLSFTFSPALNVPNGESLTLFLHINVLGSAGKSTPSTYVASFTSPTSVGVPTGVNVLLGTPAPSSASLTIIEYFISLITPTSVAPGTSEQDIVIEGSGFTSPVTLTIGGVYAGGFAQVSPDGTMITGLTVPEHTGTGLEIVLSTGLLGPRTLTQKFSYATEDDASAATALCSLNGSGSGYAWLLLIAAALGSTLLMRRREA